MRDDRATTAADAVRKLMQTLGLAERLKADEVLVAWREIVGEFFAKHSCPQQLKDRVLYVSVLQPTVVILQPIASGGATLSPSSTERFGARTVREIKFRLG